MMIKNTAALQRIPTRKRLKRGVIKTKHSQSGSCAICWAARQGVSNHYTFGICLKNSSTANSRASVSEHRTVVVEHVLLACWMEALWERSMDPNCSFLTTVSTTSL